MLLISPSFTLVLMIFLGATIESSPLLPRSFIGPEELVENGMMNKRSSNPFSFVLRSFVALEALKEQGAGSRMAPGAKPGALFLVMAGLGCTLQVLIFTCTEFWGIFAWPSGHISMTGYELPRAGPSIHYVIKK